MHKTGRLLGHLPLALIALVPDAGWTRPVEGQLGAQSQSHIAIGASVLPHFQVHEEAGALEVITNAPKLRYDLAVSLPGRLPVPMSASRTFTGEKLSITAEELPVSLGGDDLLVLVVPD
ncbi:MAG TPA: hypothetical protein VGU01_05825 [Sphingomicrobium sp.]|nr:hypothetical protein [Sphingomicrobium sp.]